MHKRKIFPKLLTAVFILICAAISVQARVTDGGDPMMRPQVGIWFGPVTPVYTLWDQLDPYLGGGAYARYGIFHNGQIGFDASYQNHTSKGVKQLMLIPTYGSFIYRLPINTPIMFSLKAGAGAGYVKIMPENKSQFDPLFTTGFEMAFPAGPIVNIGLRIDYIFLYESYLPGARLDGHVVNAGLTLYFNLDI